MVLYGSGYQKRLNQMENDARSAILSFQSEHDSAIDTRLDPSDLSSAPFPRGLIESIRDSDLDSVERQKLICYLIGSWYIDHSGGCWAYVPMLIDAPSLYLQFGIGVETDGTMWNAAETAKDIIDGEDLDLVESILQANLRVLERNSAL